MFGKGSLVIMLIIQAWKKCLYLCPNSYQTHFLSCQHFNQRLAKCYFEHNLSIPFPKGTTRKRGNRKIPYGTTQNSAAVLRLESKEKNVWNVTFYEIQEVAVCSSVCVSLLRFCMLANKYFDILQIRITFCWKNKHCSCGYTR